MSQQGDVLFTAGSDGVLRDFHPAGARLSIYARVGAAVIDDLTFDRRGNLYAADVSRNVIWKITPARKAIIVAGNGHPGFSGDRRDAREARLNDPAGVAVDSKGDMYVADMGNDRVRRVDVRSGVIRTIAGGGSCNPRSHLLCGVGGPARRARLGGVQDVAVDAHGNVFLASGRVLEVPVRSRKLYSIAGSGHIPLTSQAIEAQRQTLPADKADLEASALELDPAGNLYVAEESLGLVREVVLHAAGR